jgi:ADP-ribosylglycohydrolase
VAGFDSVRRLTTAQHDRAAGVLLGQACGDALGVPYEFAPPPRAHELAEMKGGGLGNSKPGEWSDDTAMAVAVAHGLACEDWLDAVAAEFLRWYDDNPPDIGLQTQAVLEATVKRRLPSAHGLAELMTAEAQVYAAHDQAAGNGALMRTGPVALAFLHDREGCAFAARRIASLTHADPLAGDACVLWSEAIRIAVVEGRLDVEGGLDLIPEDRRTCWALWLADARTGPARRFAPNGFTVSALQAAWAAILHTPQPPDEPGAALFACQHFQEALHAAVRIGDDTDTVAAIAGALLGAYWGASAVPWRWRRAVHGWPGRDGRDLTSQAWLLARRGHVDGRGWPLVADVAYAERADGDVVPHPHDSGVLLGTHRSRGHGATAAVSLCRVGRQQACFEGLSTVVESRLLDDDDPTKNPHLHFALYDAADAVRGLRAEGHTVLLHCVAAQQRTPSIAVAYSVLLGHTPEEARRAVLDVLPDARGHGALWDAAGELGGLG